MNLIKIILSLIILSFLIGCTTNVDNTEGITITDYDINGNIIYTEFIPFTNSNLQAVSLPEKFQGIASKKLPLAFNNTYKRSLVLKIQNDGNIESNINIIEAKVVGEYAEK